MGRMGFNVPTPVEWLLLLSLQIAKEGREGATVKLSRTIPFEDSQLFWLRIKPHSRRKGTESG